MKKRKKVSKINKPINPELEREQKEKDIQEGKKENMVDKGMLPVTSPARGVPFSSISRGVFLNTLLGVKHKINNFCCCSIIKTPPIFDICIVPNKRVTLKPSYTEK